MQYNKDVMQTVVLLVSVRFSEETNNAPPFCGVQYKFGTET